MTFKQLDVPFASPYYINQGDLDAISSFLDKMDRSSLEFTPWSDYAYKPQVDFAIACSDTSILLKYYVTEEVIRAYYNRVNDPVYKDTCVEFFIALDNEVNYYNFEFNCVGNCLVGFGPDRNRRELLKYSSLKKLRTQTLIKSIDVDDQSLVHWELTLEIPFDAFSFHSISSLQGRTCRANFYKCGDELAKPHYVTWNNIVSEAPNFHLFPYFGKLQF